MCAISNFLSAFFAMPPARIVAAIFGAIIASAAGSQASACACCTNVAHRYVETEKLESRRLSDISQITFARDARLKLDEADEGIKGLEGAGGNFSLSVSQRKDRWIFSLTDAKGRSGNLTLVLPKTISIFEVDPRDGEDKGLGPVLYKEWKLNAGAAGDGIFRTTTGGKQKLTLVLHGRGLGCTEASHFSHWSLLIHGPTDTYTFYGDLTSFAK